MKVSVIIPSYNYAHFLPETLENLLRQAYSDWECIIVDNNSTDDTKSVVEEFLKKDNRFKYFFNLKKGPSSSRNMGIEKSTGELIQFLDADDLLQHNKFKNAIDLFSKNKTADLVYGGVRYFDDGKPGNLFYSMRLDGGPDNPWMSCVQGGRKEVLPELLLGNIMVISSPLIRKTSLMEVGVFDESLDFNEDWELWIRFALRNKVFVYDDSADTMALIRVHNTSHSRDGFKMYYSGLKVCRQILPLLNNEENNEAFSRKIKFHELTLKKMILEKCSDRDLTIERLSGLSAISPVFAKMLKQAAKTPLPIRKFLFFVNYTLSNLKYQSNA